MTEPDNFILRWARLKRESDIEHETDTSRDGSAIEPKETVLVLPEATPHSLGSMRRQTNLLIRPACHRLKRSLPTRTSAGFCKAACPPN